MTERKTAEQLTDLAFELGDALRELLPPGIAYVVALVDTEDETDESVTVVSPLDPQSEQDLLAVALRVSKHSASTYEPEDYARTPASELNPSAYLQVNVRAVRGRA